MLLQITCTRGPALELLNDIWSEACRRCMCTSGQRSGRRQVVRLVSSNHVEWRVKVRTAAADIPLVDYSAGRRATRRRLMAT